MRTVLSVDPLGGVDPSTDAERLTVRVVRSPFNVNKANVAQLLTLAPGDLPDWSAPDAVRERGRRVRDSLSQHPGVAQVLQQVFTAPVGQQQPLFVMLSESEAEQINWETLCDSQDQFVALDPRWPIGRITDPMTGQSRPPAELALPVRMMVLISAFGIKGQEQEWKMLRDAVLAARQAGVPVVVKALVGPTALADAIRAEIAAGLADVEVAPIDKTPARVVQAIAEWSPNIVHCFCHGRSELDDQSIELATALDYAQLEAAAHDGGQPPPSAGSVRIGVRQWVALSTQLANPWLMTLNCCSSGQSAKNLHSLAHQIVSAGFPAAVAMLEPVDARDAYEFSRAFYRSLFTAIGRAAQSLQAAVRVPFEWSEAMVGARTAICDLHNGDATNAHEWALPALYVRGIDPFHFERARALPAGEANAHKASARLIAEWLQTAGRRRSEDERRAVMEAALAGVPKEFWPRVDGSFADG